MDGPGILTINLSSLPADYNIVLYDINGTSQLAIGNNTGTTNEQIIYNYTISASTIKYIKVLGNSGAFNQCNDYVLGISWTPASTPTATINSFTISPTTVCPGKFFFNIKFNNRFCSNCNVILGASIRLWNIHHY
ncbi:MAG: hypothetical protein IPN09_13370 [Bacteroidetes bacterium]|nr:hypothetical protein [Bacteroidota bacterium]